MREHAGICGFAAACSGNFSCRRIPWLRAVIPQPVTAPATENRLELHFLGVAPEALQVVILAGLFAKDVNQEVAVIQQNPFGVLIALHAIGTLPKFAKLRLHFVGNRLNLPRVGAAGNDEKVGKRGDVAQVQNGDILGLF